VSRARLGDTINDLSIVPLGPFPPEVADQFLAALADSCALALDAPTRARLIERAGWLIPFHLQALFSRLFDLCAETGEAPEPPLVDRVVRGGPAHAGLSRLLRRLASAPHGEARPAR
jgi:hypothetical protein